MGKDSQRTINGKPFSYQRRYYSHVYKAIREMGLHPDCYAILLEIEGLEYASLKASNPGLRGWAWPKRQYLADTIGINEPSQISKYTKLLTEKGLLERSTVAGVRVYRTTTLYKSMLPHFEEHTPAESIEKGVTNSNVNSDSEARKGEQIDTNGVTDSHTVVSRYTEEKEKKESESKSAPTPTPISITLRQPEQVTANEWELLHGALTNIGLFVEYDTSERFAGAVRQSMKERPFTQNAGEAIAALLASINGWEWTAAHIRVWRGLRSEIDLHGWLDIRSDNPKKHYNVEFTACILAVQMCIDNQHLKPMAIGKYATGQWGNND